MGVEDLDRDRLLLIGKAARVLSESLEVEAALQRLGEVLVPSLADWFAVDLVEDGQVRNVLVMHPDPRKVALAHELQRRFPSDPDAPSGSPHVIRTGISELTETISDDMLEALIDDDDLLETMRGLALRCAMVVPLRARGRVIGAITMIGSETHHRYSQDDLALAEQIATSAALAIDTSQLFAQEQQARTAALEQSRRTEILKDATAAFGRASTVDEVVGVMLQRGIRPAGASAGTVGIVEGDDVSLVGVTGYEQGNDRYWHRFGLGETLPMADAIRQARAVVLSTTEERNVRYPALIGRGEQADHTLVCIPMLLGGQPVGAFSASYPPGAAFSEDELSLLSSIGEQCAQAIDRARARDRAERAISRLDAVSAASQGLARTLDLEPVLETVLQLGAEYLGRTIALALRGSSDVVVHPAPNDGSRPAWIDEALRFARATDIGGQPVVVATAGRPTLVIGLRIADAHPGILIVGDPTIDVDDPEDVRFAGEIARRMARAIENARLYTDRDFVAKTLQRSLLPPALPEMDWLEIAALFLPAELEHGIGGDFYDVFQMADGRTVALVGDVCGKGVEAATVTGIARRTLRALTHLRRPSELLDHLNRTLMQEDLDERFCTVALTILEPTEGGRIRATLALAGHPQPLSITAEGEPHKVGRPGTLLGVTEDVGLEDVVIDLERGASLMLYTDGLIGKDEGIADEPAALVGVLRGRTWSSASALRDRIEGFVTWEAGDRHDDIAVLVLRVP
jgi:GAF domain-containing protein